MTCVASERKSENMKKAKHTIKIERKPDGTPRLIWSFSDHDSLTFRKIFGIEEQIIVNLGFSYEEFTKRFFMCADSYAYEYPHAGIYLNIDLLADCDEYELTLDINENLVSAIQFAHNLVLLLSIIYSRMGQPYEIKTYPNLKLRL